MTVESVYYVYILRSLKNNRYYIGYTTNLLNRLTEHNTGETKGNRYFRPFELVYQEEYKTLTEARDRESFLKEQKSRKFLESLFIIGA
ncbi:MAG: GIY-YIG nuclease family protein [Candidatus Margulisiibacteriota bacterium]|jgi:putative endonuclease